MNSGVNFVMSDFLSVFMQNIFGIDYCLIWFSIGFNLDTFTVFVSDFLSEYTWYVGGVSNFPYLVFYPLVFVIYL